MVSFIGPGPPESPNITLRRRLATGLAHPVRASGGPHCAPHKNGIAASCLICFVAGLLPWLRLRTVLRASCPSDARGMNRHRELGCIGTLANHSSFMPFDNAPSHFNAVPHHPRSCSASAGRDSLRSVGHAANAATLLNWNIALHFEDTCFDERYSHFAASCSRRVRLASLPSRPSSARRPCTRFLTSHLFRLLQAPLAIPTGNTSNRTGWHPRPLCFERGTHPAKTLRWHRAIASQFQHLRQRNDQCTSSREHWNVHSGSAGLEAFRLRSRLSSGGFC
jgi:hypothetical protein